MNGPGGFGLGTFETVYPHFALFDIGLIVNHAHNDWLEWAAEGGVPLALALLSLAVWAARPAFGRYGAWAYWPCFCTR